MISISSEVSVKTLDFTEQVALIVTKLKACEVALQHNLVTSYEFLTLDTGSYFVSLNITEEML